LPKYAHKYIPRSSTSINSLLDLALKNFWRTDYRGVVAQLEDNPTLTVRWASNRVPHFTTLPESLENVCSRWLARDRLLERHDTASWGRRRRVRWRRSTRPVSNARRPAATH